MKELQTRLGEDIPVSTRGILYLCAFNNLELIVLTEMCFQNAGTALNAYANIPNPESQLVTGKTYDELITELHTLHKNMDDVKWLKELEDYL
jgi:hypothetical protein